MDTASAPYPCWVMPMLQTKTALRLRMSKAANSSIEASGRPAAFSSVAMSCR